MNTSSPSAISSEPNRDPSNPVPSARSSSPREPLGCSEPEYWKEDLRHREMLGVFHPVSAPGQKPPCPSVVDISKAAQVRFLMVDRDDGSDWLQIHSSSSLITVLPTAEGITLNSGLVNLEYSSIGPNQLSRNITKAATSECGWLPIEIL